MNNNYHVIDRFTDSEIYQRATKLQKNINCKFVLLSNNYNIILIFGDLFRHPYHADILEFYCNSQTINSGWKKKPDEYEIYDSTITILGGGWMDFNPISKNVTIFGQSTAYGKYNHDILFELFQNSKNLNGFNFSIEKI